jgi:tetratricopeptide (TPR) repeat protein
MNPPHLIEYSIIDHTVYSDQGKLDEAERMYQRAPAGNEKALGPDHKSTLHTVNNLGLLYRDQGKLDEAEQMYQRALLYYQHIYGPLSRPGYSYVQDADISG